MNTLPTTARADNQLNRVQIPLILMLLLGIVRIVLNIIKFPGLNYPSWSPLRLIQNFIYDYWGYRISDADQVVAFDRLWLISDVPTRLFAVVAILVLVRAISVKRATVVFGALTAITVLISIARLARFHYESGLRDNVLLNLTIGLNNWLPYGLFTAWVYIAAQTTQTTNPILPQTFQSNPRPSE
jgi:hypothetical protein